MSSMQINSSNLFIPNRLGNLDVSYEKGNFFIKTQTGKYFQVESINLSKELRGISQENLQKCLDVAYLALNQGGDSYSISLISGELSLCISLIIFSIVASPCNSSIIGFSKSGL